MCMYVRQAKDVKGSTFGNDFCWMYINTEVLQARLAPERWMPSAADYRSGAGARWPLSSFFSYIFQTRYVMALI